MTAIKFQKKSLLAQNILVLVLSAGCVFSFLPISYGKTIISQKIKCTPSDTYTSEGIKYGCTEIDLGNLLAATIKNDMGNFKKFTDAISRIDTPILRLYLVNDTACNWLPCHGIPIEKVRTFITNEIELRNETEKNSYTRFSLITGTLSMIISMISLSVSVMTFIRNRKSTTVKGPSFSALSDIKSKNNK